jgi:phage gp36-like protein
MGYATQADMIARYGETELIQLTDDHAVPGMIAAEVVASALADADAVIDSHLVGGGYTLPLATAYPILIKTACALARYSLYRAERPEAVQADYADALGWLVNLARGTVSLPAASAPAGVATATRTMVYDATFLDAYGP